MLEEWRGCLCLHFLLSRSEMPRIALRFIRATNTDQRREYGDEYNFRERIFHTTHGATIDFDC